MTNQQGAPEALRPIQRFNNFAGLMNPETRGLYVRYEDHVAAIAALHAAHVQNPAEIEHVAGDVSKNGAELNMSAQQPAPATQQAEVRPVTPYTCPKCHALWLHWPAEQSGFGMDTLNCRSTTHCDYCEKGGVEQLERLERVPAALKAPQQEAQEPVGYTHASWIAEAKRGGGGSFVGRKNAAFDVPIYTAPPHSPASQGDALDAMRYRWLAASCRSTSEHWGGRWSIIIDGPAPKSHDSEDDFDAAIDAARAAQEGKSHG